MKKFWIKKALMILFFGAIAITVFGFIVMGLWNAILPAVLGVKTITFIQALGILLLSKILFGGFNSKRWGNHRQEWKEKMKQRFETMTPDEKEKFKAEWKNRCGGMWGRFENPTTTKEEQ
ncbi:hypothetical protein [Ferruginibacter sp.]|nr:hypothetical protein [Ferruginibacter sp.]